MLSIFDVAFDSNDKEMLEVLKEIVSKPMGAERVAIVDINHGCTTFRVVYEPILDNYILISLSDLYSTELNYEDDFDLIAENAVVDYIVYTYDKETGYIDYNTAHKSWVEDYSLMGDFVHEVRYAMFHNIDEAWEVPTHEQI